MGEIPKQILERLRILEAIAYCASELIDGHDEILGETCYLCKDGEDSHGEQLRKLLDDFFNR